MTDDINLTEYRDEVESTAQTILDKLEDYPEDYDDEWEVIHETVDFHGYVTKNHLFLPVIQFASNDPEEWKTYVKDSEENHWKVLGAMAYTAFRADVYDEIENIREVRDDLGEAISLIEGPIYDGGVTFEYEYEKGITDPVIVSYTLESVDALGNEWRVIDPDGKTFEIISPSVMIEDATVPEKRFKVKLDNICAKREHKREQDDE